MRRPVYIVGAGAVTPAGLDARQTAAAIRSNLSAYEEISLPEPLGELQIAARIPRHRRLAPDDGTWLVNMAARALGEALATGSAAPEDTSVLMAPPETFRDHPGYETVPPSGFLAAVAGAMGVRFHASSRAVDGGAAACIGLIERAAELLESGGVAQVLLGGVDSLVNDVDLARLAEAGRLAGEDNPQGLVPAEGAVFVRLTRDPIRGGQVEVAIHGCGVAQETDSVLSDRFSQGRALVSALRAAVGGAGPAEKDIDFIVCNGNGERYSGLEQLTGRSRFYRTRREIFPTAYPASTVGEIGAAAGALTLMVAADSFVQDYAPGRYAACEVASESGLRAAAIVGEIRRK